MCLGNISQDFAINNMKKLGLIGTIKAFSVDYNATDAIDILGIHRHLLKQTCYKIITDLLKNDYRIIN